MRGGATEEQREALTRIMNSEDLYSILGIDQDADAKGIKDAYRQVARLIHPDKCNDEDATAAFQKISEAYETLSEPTHRNAHDSDRNAHDSDREALYLKELLDEALNGSHEKILSLLEEKSSSAYGLLSVLEDKYLEGFFMDSQGLENVDKIAKYLAYHIGVYADFYSYLNEVRSADVRSWRRRVTGGFIDIFLTNYEVGVKLHSLSPPETMSKDRFVTLLLSLAKNTNNTTIIKELQPTGEIKSLDRDIQLLVQYKDVLTDTSITDLNFQDERRMTALMHAVLERDIDGDYPRAIYAIEALMEYPRKTLIRLIKSALRIYKDMDADNNQWVRSKIDQIKEFRHLEKLARDLVGKVWVGESSKYSEEEKDELLTIHEEMESVYKMVDLDIQDKEGMTALMHAVSKSDIGSKLVDVILGNGANPNIQDNLGRTALHMQSSALLSLLRYRSDPNIQNNLGQTALHVYSDSMLPYHVEVLLRYGADLNIRNNHGKTALDLARTKPKSANVERVVELLSPSTYFDRVNVGKTYLQFNDPILAELWKEIFSLEIDQNKELWLLYGNTKYRSKDGKQEEWSFDVAKSWKSCRAWSCIFG